VTRKRHCKVTILKLFHKFVVRNKLCKQISPFSIVLIPFTTVFLLFKSLFLLYNVKVKIFNLCELFTSGLNQFFKVLLLELKLTNRLVIQVAKLIANNLFLLHLNSPFGFLDLVFLVFLLYQLLDEAFKLLVYTFVQLFVAFII